MDMSRFVLNKLYFPLVSSKVTEEVSNISFSILIQLYSCDINCIDIKYLFISGITVQGTEGEVPILFLQQKQTCRPK